MKSKIGLLAVVLISGLLLSACTNKSTSQNTLGENNQQNQIEVRPSGPDEGRGPEQQMDLVAAAAKLGISEEVLKAALGITEETEQVSVTSGAKPSGEPKKMDLTAAAEILEVTEDDLKEALGINNMPNGGERPEGSPPAENN